MNKKPAITAITVILLAIFMAGTPVRADLSFDGVKDFGSKALSGYAATIGAGTSTHPQDMDFVALSGSEPLDVMSRYVEYDPQYGITISSAISRFVRTDRVRIKYQAGGLLKEDKLTEVKPDPISGLSWRFDPPVNPTGDPVPVYVVVEDLDGKMPFLSIAGFRLTPGRTFSFLGIGPKKNVSGFVFFCRPKQVKSTNANAPVSDSNWVNQDAFNKQIVESINNLNKQVSILSAKPVTPKIVDYTIHVVLPFGVDGYKLQLEGGEVRWHSSSDRDVKIVGAGVGPHWGTIIIPGHNIRFDYSIIGNGQVIDVHLEER